MARKLTYQWYDKTCGTYCLAQEKQVLDNWLPKLFGYHLLQVGDSNLAALSQASLVRHKMILHPEPPDSPCLDVTWCPGLLSALPMQEESIDVVLMTHALESTAAPEQALAEAHRVLIPEGYLLVTGFSPASGWGWRAKRLAQRATQSLHLLSLMRLQHMLRAAGFQVLAGELFCFTPVSAVQFGQKPLWLERWGPKLCPFLAGQYAILAAKHDYGLTPLRPKWRQARVWEGGLVNTRSIEVLDEPKNSRNLYRWRLPR